MKFPTLFTPEQLQVLTELEARDQQERQAQSTHPMRVRAVSRAEGFLETAWFDPTSKRSVGQEHRHVGRVFRMRAYADSVPPARSELVIETVFRRTADPSAPGREEEIIAPPGHPGDSLTQLVLDSLRRRFPR